MMNWPRGHGDCAEWLDDPRVDDAIRIRTQREVERANAWFGGDRAVLAEMRPLLRRWPTGRALVVDVGTGAGGIARLIRSEGRRHGVVITTIGLDLRAVLARAARTAGSVAVRGDALSLPFADRAADVVVCSQLLHHFRRDEALRLLRELARVARRRVIVCDLRRSWLAAGGFWVAARTAGFHPVTRHDGVVSVLRGFSSAELLALIQAVGEQAPTVRRRLGFRLAASWVPSPGRARKDAHRPRRGKSGP
jgi:SAM-dependent methyltransferase